MLTIFAVAFASTIAAQEGQSREAIDVFVEACQWRGGNPGMIWSGYIEYDQVVTTPPMTDASMEREIDQRVKNFQAAIDAQKDPKMKSEMQKILARIPDAVRTQVGNERRSRVKVLFDGNDISGKRKFEVVNYNQAMKQWDKQMVAIRRGASKEGGDNVLWDPDSSMATVSHVDLNVEDPHHFGRIRGTPARLATVALLNGMPADGTEFSKESISQFKGNSAVAAVAAGIKMLVVDPNLEYEEGGIAYAIEVVDVKKPEKTPGHVRQRYWIDTARGAVCPLVQTFDGKGNLTEEWRSSGYFLHEASGLWFPSLYVHTKNEHDTGKLVEKKTFTIKKDGFQINQPVNDDQFAIKIPEGFYVVDERGTVKKQYKVTKEAELSFKPGGLDLDKINEISLIGSISGARGDGGRGLVFLLVNAIFFAAIVLFFGIRWRRNAVRSSALIVLSAGLFGGACVPGGDAYHVNKDVLKIEPQRIDFGRVRETDAPLKLGVTLSNLSKNPIRISDINSGCGCTVVASDVAEIGPNGKLFMPISVKTRGRLGEFSNVVSFSDSSTGDVHKVHVHGQVVRDIWSNDQVVQSVLEEDDEMVEGFFEVSTLDFPGVQFDFANLNDSISIKEVSRQKLNEETQIRFGYMAKVPVGRYSTEFNVVLEPVDNKINSLPIRIVCIRPSLKQDRDNADQVIRPSRISLGVLPPGGSRRVRIFGSSELMGAIVGVKAESVPEGFGVHVDHPHENNEKWRDLEITLDKNSKNMYVNGVLFIVFNDGTEYPVRISAAIRK